jgi:predicted RecB family nuclease
MQLPITASMLYDLVECPHRVTMDLFADPASKDEASPFVRLLWERGAAHEDQIVAALGIPLFDLSTISGDEKENRTTDAMVRGESLIYAGRIRFDDLLGEPDLLRREGDGYVPGDIKSGRGEEGTEEGSKPKVHYAVQLALYADILERKGLSAGRRGFIWDVNGDEFNYDLMAPYGIKSPRLLWSDYQTALESARAIVARTEVTLPAYSSGLCKNCQWYTACLARLVEADDLTLIPELGRSKRDVMRSQFPTIRELAASDPSSFTDGKKTIFPGIGPATLQKFHRRAVLLAEKDGHAYLREPVSLPRAALEIFFDIEVDPMREICYLHGFVERLGGDNDKERYIAFFADTATPEAEEAAFSGALNYLMESSPAMIYYYSKYERTIWRKLREKYPKICSAVDLEALFDPSRSVDLYQDVVQRATEWPTRDFSIKTLATHLGFVWRDTHPSGAASIEWFDRWVQSGDPAIKQRILDYNEDDCRATRVLLDGIRSLATLPS